MGESTLSNSAQAIAENIMRVATTGVGELDVPAMKKYIQYCKARCAPRLSEQAGDVLASSYVKIRDDVRKRSIDVSLYVHACMHACYSCCIMSSILNIRYPYMT
jgi:DNA replicative helicase MCM subunit Mcm2 (Cdc46/Mcm family)